MSALMNGIMSEVGKDMAKNIIQEGDESSVNWKMVGKYILIGIGVGVGFNVVPALINTYGKEKIKFNFWKKRREEKEKSKATAKTGTYDVSSSPVRSVVRGKTMDEILTKNERTPIEKKQVIGQLLYKGQIGFMVGTPDSGKSLTLNGEAEALASGLPSFLDPYQTAREAMAVDYYSLELDEEEQDTRYGTSEVDYSKNIRYIFLSEFDNTNYYESIMNDMEVRIKTATEDKLIILDNLSKIARTSSPTIITSTYNRLEAAQRMAKESGFCVTILIVLHTNRDVKNNKIITENHIGASWEAVKYAKSLFAIAPGQLGPQYRYIKNLKNKHGEKSDMVSVIKIEKEPFLHSEFIEFRPEIECVRPTSYEESPTPTKRGPQKTVNPKVEARIIELIQEGISTYEKIAEEMNVSLSRVKRLGAELRKAQSKQ
ncbi:MAG: AAA family ATPase [Muribaculaceae bacterium]|nr:AAA family ATPase [Muribaculaceae bacterium]